jgi:hypothetical protein
MQDDDGHEEDVRDIEKACDEDAAQDRVSVYQSDVEVDDVDLLSGEQKSG